MATPTLRAIRTRFAEAHITFLIEANLHDLARGGDWMNTCVQWPPKDQRTPFHKEFRDLTWDLRRRRFEWAVLLPNSLRAALTAHLAGARRRIGYDRDGRGLFLTDRIPVANRRDGRFVPTPLVEYLADLAVAIGCDRPGDRLELFTTPDCDATVQRRLSALGIAGHHPLVVISPGAKYGAAKCWPPDRFAATADKLIDSQEAAVIVTCGPGEEPIAQEIGASMLREAFVFDDPRLTLGEMKSLVQRSDLLICNDAGPRHFAKAFDVPVVTIFGPTYPEWTATGYQAERIARIDVDCGPCQKRICPHGHLKCMTGVTVEAVVQAATELLETRVGHTIRP